MKHNLHLERKLSRIEKIQLLLVIGVPFAALLFCLFSGMLWQISRFTLLLFIVCYCLSLWGLTIGYHRLTTHDSFKTHRFFQYTLLALGCTMFQGPPVFWICAHRRHHKFSDRTGDPHSPRHQQRIWRNFLHAHFAWLLSHEREEWHYYGSDLIKNPAIMWINRHYYKLAIAGVIIPGIINGLYFMSWYHFIEGMLICGLVRVCLLQHITWAVNSICHLWGRKDFETGDNSRNNLIMGLLALGEGWHNGHHAFPRSARHGLLWWQLDITYLVIRLLGFIGLAQKISQPNRTAVKKRHERYR